MTEWITPPTEIGWYWWREKDKAEMPVYIGPGPFGNDCFKPGLGWCLRDRIGGEWWPTRIDTVRERGDSDGS